MTHNLNPNKDHKSVLWPQRLSRQQNGTSTEVSMLAHNFHDRQEWMRVRQVVRCFSIGRSSLYKLLHKGLVKSVSIKERGALRGIRLVNADSVRNYLETLA